MRHDESTQTSPLEQSVFTVHGLLHPTWGTGDGDGVGDDVIVGVGDAGQVQLASSRQDTFRQRLSEQTKPLGQSELTVQVLLHCGLGVEVGVAVLVGVLVGVSVGVAVTVVVPVGVFVGVFVGVGGVILNANVHAVEAA